MSRETERHRAVLEQLAIARPQVRQTGLTTLSPPVPVTVGASQSLINQLIKAIRANQELNEIFQLAIEGIAQTILVDRAAIVLLKYADPLLKGISVEQLPQVTATVAREWYAAVDRAPSSAVERSFRMSECSLSQFAFVQAPKPVAIASLKLANAQHHFPTKDARATIADVFHAQKMPAFLSVPLLATANGTAQTKVLGFLILQHQQPRVWQPAELELAELVAAQLSNAIIQTQTLRQVQALVEERTAQLQRSLEIQAKLYEQTRRQIGQLQHLNHLKDEFLDAVGHELRTPLATMKMAISLLRQPQISTEQREQYLEILDRQCDRETNLIDELLTLQDLESNRLTIHRQQIGLKGLIGELAQFCEQAWTDKKLTLVVDLPERSLQLQSDYDSLRRILQELLTNAGKYSYPGTAVVFRGRAEANQIIFSVSNTGAGISTEELPYIFDKFHRGSGVTQQAVPGTGLGLALVKCLVQHLDGTIVASSRPSDDPERLESRSTCFTITLPQLSDE